MLNERKSAQDLAQAKLPRSGMPVLSATNFLAGLIFGSVGFVGFIYGKRMHNWRPMLLGLALMAYPYFIESTAALCAVGLAGTALLIQFGR